jgi:hypothetical protein
VTAEVEESDVDGVGVVAGDGEVDSCGRVLVHNAEGAEVCDVGGIDEGESGVEAPVGGDGKHCVLDVGIGLGTAELLDVSHDHAHHLFKGKRVLALREEVGAIFEAVAL